MIDTKLSGSPGILRVKQETILTKFFWFINAKSDLLRPL